MKSANHSQGRPAVVVLTEPLEYWTRDVLRCWGFTERALDRATYHYVNDGALVYGVVEVDGAFVATRPRQTRELPAWMAVRT